jgi:hypothetical protein
MLAPCSTKRRLTNSAKLELLTHVPPAQATGLRTELETLRAQQQKTQAELDKARFRCI